MAPPQVLVEAVIKGEAAELGAIENVMVSLVSAKPSLMMVMPNGIVVAVV